MTIPNSVTSIGNCAFEDCSGLTSLTIPNSVTKIGSSAFYRCSGLTSVTIPNSVTSIGEYAFEYCSSLTSLTIGNSVTTIGNYAFSDCKGLTSVTIPNSVTSIGDYAFAYCSGLTSVSILNSIIGLSMFRNCKGLTSVTIGNSVTTIGNSAFDGCTGITKITIPKTVKTIGSNAFACNDKLEVYVEWENPADETLSFAQQPFSNKISYYGWGTLFVPTGKKVLYEQTAPWEEFKKIVEYTVDGIEEIEAEGGVTIGVEGGKIVVSGAGDAKVEVFGTNGATVYSGAADNLPELVAGIYVVRVGSTVKKVAVAQ